MYNSQAQAPQSMIDQIDNNLLSIYWRLLRATVAYTSPKKYRQNNRYSKNQTLKAQRHNKVIRWPINRIKNVGREPSQYYWDKQL